MKRGFDLAVALAALIVLAPLMVLLSIPVRLSLGSPVLFRQPRPGFRGKIFQVLKFRTMTDVRDAYGCLLPDGDRLRPFGAFLRSTSLDELPQLVNVLQGDLSLVGPRPLLVHYLDRYTPEQARRHDVLPGITGWTQVNGRNALTWDEKFALDLWYVDHWSLILDMKILAMTVAKVLGRKGVSGRGSATMPEFMGSPDSEGGA